MPWLIKRSHMKLRRLHLGCWLGIAGLIVLGLSSRGLVAPGQQTAASSGRFLTQADCTTAKLGSEIPASAIGEKVSHVALNEPRWTTASGNAPGYCSIDGTMSPADRSANAKPINFRVVLPATWNHRAAQL